MNRKRSDATHIYKNHPALPEDACKVLVVWLEGDETMLIPYCDLPPMIHLEPISRQLDNFQKSFPQDLIVD